MSDVLRLVRPVTLISIKEHLNAFLDLWSYLYDFAEIIVLENLVLWLVEQTLRLKSPWKKLVQHRWLRLTMFLMPKNFTQDFKGQYFSNWLIVCKLRVERTFDVAIRFKVYLLLILSIFGNLECHRFEDKLQHYCKHLWRRYQAIRPKDVAYVITKTLVEYKSAAMTTRVLVLKEPRMLQEQLLMKWEHRPRGLTRWWELRWLLVAKSPKRFSKQIEYLFIVRLPDRYGR
jgi:hypothetical protein